ncbi:MAG: bifunctional (p)ppGpp synthetase/guanosine-3',5'-bis(diphosphate) 3'-pyrophosphohydrolase [Bacteroidaceae bacterium]|nr:bifunctional (p)ppGpp synthetase/guanosine-3',5'-bis(diphosphate) 3'-pyrophosphohydrolase [Bacteroidaceae bacterium]MDO5489119.1 RelA/SpoT family protein [Bacteroidaceae bacterium]
MDRTKSEKFSPEEIEKVKNLDQELSRLAEKALQPGDYAMVRSYLKKAAESDCIQRDSFGFHPIINDLETAVLVVQEIGLSRGSVIGIMISTPVKCGSASIEQVKKDFGDDVAHIISGLLRIRDLYKKSATVESENFRSLLVTFAEDMRVILIMIANRVNTMRKIKDTPQAEAQRKVSMEAAYLYAPLAHKLGLYKLKSELEDLSLKYLEHDAYYHIKEKLNETKRSRDAYIADFIAPIEKKLTEAGLKFHMKGRTKSIHSIWQKMKKQHVGVDGVYDLFAIRIILDSEPEKEKMDCWQTFSIITDMYQSNPKRMRDWLSVPKSNGYESLHITVLGPKQKWVEVQIRTERMDDIAEHGLAAHWRYKGIRGGQNGVDEWLANVRSVLETGDDMQLMDQFKQDLVEDEVFVFTPKGDLFKLPMGATVLDFAYSIHTKVGDQCIGAKIGNKNVTIRQKLQSGDQVEILTSKNQTPKQDWLNIVITGKARTKIRQSIKEMESKQAHMAKEVLERKMNNRKIDYDEAVFMHTITRMGYKVVTDFYADIANDTLDINHVLETYAATLKHARGEAEHTAPAQSAKDFVMQPDDERKLYGNNDDVMVIDENLKGIDFQMAKCCQPVYGDEVFGFVTNGNGIKIHRTDCTNAPQLRQRFGYRIVKARWAGKRGTQYPITLHVVGNDDLGIVNNITSIISKEEKILLRSISIDSFDGLFSGRLTVMLEDTSKLQKLIKRLKTIKGIKNVSRN